MKFLTFLLILTAPLLAQQLVVPTDLTPAQQRAFKRITEGVSAPCCSNAIPVAYHESGMAVYVRDFVAEKLGQGLSEKEVMKAVMDLRLGPDKLPVISATPEVKGLGLVAWTAPFILILLMVGFILSRSSRSSHEVVDEKDLIELYRPAILKQLAGSGGKN